MDELYRLEYLCQRCKGLMVGAIMPLATARDLIYTFSQDSSIRYLDISGANKTQDSIATRRIHGCPDKGEGIAILVGCGVQK